MEFEREDWLLVVLVAAAVLPFGYSLMNSGGGFTPDTGIERYCVGLAADIEANVSFADRIKDCRCVPPEDVNESRFSAPEKVVNATRLFLISCKMETGGKQIFPIRRIREDYAGEMNRSNTSLLRDSP
ncbi:MAG: hypothetical protein SVS85_03090 [Candidatus Nanohaloarchaea archaeon]|nr:hypothetical protein [Candidatus Nanohaloarchaea archaeon]